MNTFGFSLPSRVRFVTATPEPAAPQDPRSYPAGVTLVKRSARGAASAPDKVTIAEIEEWLLHGATLENDMLTLMESFIWRMIAAGLPIDRGSLHITTLHPQLLGFAWNWRRADGFCDEVKVLHSATDSDSFKRNTLARVIETKECLRRNPQLPEAQSEFPIMRELAELGIHDYLAIPSAAVSIVTSSHWRRRARADSPRPTSSRSPICCGCSRCMWSGTSPRVSPRMRSTPISARLPA